MDLKLLFGYQRPLPGLIGIERIMMCYNIFTFILLGMVYEAYDGSAAPFIWRILIIGATLLLWQLYRRYPCNLTYVVRVVFQISLLGFWYPDIYNFAKLMPNYDHVFAHIDQLIFGFQPALVFSEALSGKFWNELFHMGYFSYYIMLIVVVLWAIFKYFRRFDRTTTVIFCSFLLYYLIYLFLQSAGPQFYFPRIGMDNVMAGNFPPIGDYFRYNDSLVHHDGAASGLFCRLVESAQQSEKPIAAFPSSHVGLSSIMIWLAFKMSKKLGLCILPFYIILCLSTVYIGAHYAIDVLGGWISAVIIYNISMLIYRSKFIHRPRKYDSLHRYGHERHHHHHHHHHESSHSSAGSL